MVWSPKLASLLFDTSPSTAKLLDFVDTASKHGRQQAAVQTSSGVASVVGRGCLHAALERLSEKRVLRQEVRVTTMRYRVTASSVRSGRQGLSEGGKERNDGKVENNKNQKLKKKRQTQQYKNLLKRKKE